MTRTRKETWRGPRLSILLLPRPGLWDQALAVSESWLPPPDPHPCSLMPVSRPRPSGRRRSQPSSPVGPHLRRHPADEAQLGLLLGVRHGGGVLARGEAALRAEREAL